MGAWVFYGFSKISGVFNGGVFYGGFFMLIINSIIVCARYPTGQVVGWAPGKVLSTLYLKNCNT